MSRMLDGVSDELALQLPFDFSRTPGTRTELESYAFDLPVPAPGVSAGDSEKLFAAAFGIELARYNSQPSIPISASRLSATGKLLWASPLRLETAQATTCRELLDQTGAMLGRPGGTSGDPIGSRAAITWLEAGRTGELDVLKVLGESGSESRDADLHLVISGAGDAIAPYRATFVYNANLFRRASIGRFARHLGVLLEGVVARLDAPISQLPLLDPTEEQWLDAVSQGQARSLPKELLHQLIEVRSTTTPEAVALEFRDERLTYAELNARANQLAHQLIAKGIGAESPVVVCVEPSFDIVVALLAILKAGGVYVPLDPSYPVARIRAILEDTRPTLIISREGLLERLELGSYDTLALDRDAALLRRRPQENPRTLIDPSQTAYVYYTSGTTGKPKGVMASHANLISYIQVAQTRYEFCDRDVMPAIARFSFSISMFELMSPLVAGGILLILEREHILDPARMSRTLEGVTFFHAGPSLLKNLLPYIRRNYADFGAFSRVRHASSGGDMIAPEVLESLKEVFSKAEIFVIYGCSEISCMGCTYPVPRDQVVTKTYVGRPFDNVIVRVLDAGLNPVPVGVVGQIHFAGGGVVKGYLNRPELTAEKFVQVGGRRFYCTGDMGRLSEDGWLEILGRNDFQIKIRGMRIELAEVEYNLRKAPGVTDGVVMTKDAANGEKALVAYVVLDRSLPTAPTTAAIRRHMVENVPDYMVPATYVELASLPLNHNMKVDRHALPEAERASKRIASAPAVRPPETPTEQRLGSIWKRILRVEQVSLDDNFFELGGHSMLAMELLGAIKSELGVSVQGLDVLRESLEVLAAICDQQLGKTPARSTARARGAGTDAVEAFHFGHENSLYGVLYTGAPGGGAALICSAVGPEDVRTHFILTRLARQLALQGVSVLRFDYFGCSDSLGESIDATLGRWQRDIKDAYDELVRRTSADEITGIGVRLGATLLGNTAKDLALAKLVLWDPIDDGSRHYTEMAEMHRRYLRSIQDLRAGRPPKRVRGGEEFLGTTYSDAALSELKALRLAPIAAPTRVEWLVTSQAVRQRALFRRVTGGRAGCNVETIEFDSCWDDAARLDDILPDVGVTKALAAMVRS